MKQLRELNPEIADRVQTEITNRNNEARDNRLKSESVEKLLKDITEKLGTTVEEAPKVVEENKNEITALMKKIDEIEGKYNEAEKEKLDAKLESQITSKLTDYKIKKNFDFMKDSLKVMTKIGESGELLVGDETLDQYLQKVVDEDVSITETKAKKVKQNDASDLYTEDELANLSEAEVIANMDKVDASMQALK